jgi:cysteinyl-tRNA synthetase
MYPCGPTVDRCAHIANLRHHLLAAVVRRALLARGIDVLQVKGITEVGHPRDDQLDRGEDKMLVDARLEDKPHARPTARDGIWLLRARNPGRATQIGAKPAPFRAPATIPSFCRRQRRTG